MGFGDLVRLYLNNQLLVDTFSNISNPTVANFEFSAGTSYHIQLQYATTQGSQIVVKKSRGTADSFLYLSWDLVGPNGISDAVAAAKQSDVAIIVVGEDVNTCGEGWEPLTT